MSKWLVFKNSHFDLKSALSHSELATTLIKPLHWGEQKIFSVDALFLKENRVGFK